MGVVVVGVVGAVLVAAAAAAACKTSLKKASKAHALSRQRPPTKKPWTNKTTKGYVIVAALMRLMAGKGMCVARALRKFAEQRPPGIYKHEYVDDLFR